MNFGRILIPLLGALLTLHCWADSEAPTGQSTAEGAACDAVRAYWRGDYEAWLALLVRPCHGTEGNAKYEAFKKDAAERFAANRTATTNNPAAGRILKVFKAREVPMNPKDAQEAAPLGFAGNQFVDLQIELPDGKTRRLRYHLLRDKDGKWYYDPLPNDAGPIGRAVNDPRPSTNLLYEAAASLQK